MIQNPIIIKNKCLYYFPSSYIYIYWVACSIITERFTFRQQCDKKCQFFNTEHILTIISSWAVSTVFITETYKTE